MTAAGKTKTRSKKIQRTAKGADMFKKTSAIATIAKAVPARLQRASKTMQSAGSRASKTVKRVSTRAMRVTKEHPGRSLVGAFAAGVVLAKVARYV